MPRFFSDTELEKIDNDRADSAAALRKAPR